MKYRLRSKRRATVTCGRFEGSGRRALLGKHVSSSRSRRASGPEARGGSEAQHPAGNAHLHSERQHGDGSSGRNCVRGGRTRHLARTTDGEGEDERRRELAGSALHHKAQPHRLRSASTRNRHIVVRASDVPKGVRQLALCPHPTPPGPPCRTPKLPPRAQSLQFHREA